MTEAKTEAKTPDPLEGLTAGERHAVQLVRTTIDCFNGIGMMDGVSRYGVLESRLMLCATAGRKLTETWGKLLIKMQWPTPPKRVDAQIIPLVKTGDESLERAVLKVLREQPAMVVMLARFLRDEEKGRPEESDYSEEWDGLLAELENTPNPLEESEAK